MMSGKRVLGRRDAKRVHDNGQVCIGKKYGGRLVVVEESPGCVTLRLVEQERDAADAKQKPRAEVATGAGAGDEDVVWVDDYLDAWRYSQTFAKSDLSPNATYARAFADCLYMDAVEDALRGNEPIPPEPPGWSWAESAEGDGVGDDTVDDAAPVSDASCPTATERTT